MAATIPVPELHGAGPVTDTTKTEQAGWRQKFEYVRLAQAAKLIGCDVDQLLHLGAIGEATLLAPVIAEGEYEWPVDNAGQKSWQEPFRASFDTSDRVILHRRDVAKIEATGWVIPRLFFSPEVAGQIARCLDGVEQEDGAGFRGMPKDVTQAKNARIRRQSKANEINIVQLTKLTASDGSEVADGKSAYELMMNHADTIPWFPARLPIDVLRATTVPSIEDKMDNRTTVDHLFLSTTEIQRLQENIPQDLAAEQRKDAITEPNKPHGNSSRFSISREEVLMAAIACLINDRKITITGIEWATIVDEKGGIFWKKGGPPLVRSEITKLLNKAKKYPNFPKWKGRDSY